MQQAEPTVEFGVFDWIDSRDAPLEQIYEQRLQLLEYADRSGFFCYHLAEHHFTPLGLAPSPLLFLSAVAQRTGRLRLGPLVCLLPLYNPLRLLGELCMLDQMSGGRLELGVGRGVSPYELGYHGVDASQTREIFREALSVLVAGFTSSRLSFKGQFYSFDNVPLVLRPMQQPYPPLWYATSTMESIPWAAERGMNLMRLGPAKAMREGTDLYERVWTEYRDDPNRLNPQVEQPRVGMNRQIFLAQTDGEAQAIAATAFRDWFRSFNQLWEAFGDTTYARRGQYEALLESETLLIGSPERVRGMIERAFVDSGCNYMGLSFAWGSLTHEQSLSSMKLFVEQVMPAFLGGWGRAR